MIPSISANKTAFSTFVEFEHAADDYIEQQLAGIPLRSVLSLYFFGISVLMCREPMYPGQPLDREAGASVISRLGHILGILRKCPVEPTGASALDAMSVWGSDTADLREALFAYAYLCEIAPYVHRSGYVASFKHVEVTLTHPSDAYAEVEKRDIILSQLFNPVSFPPPPTLSFWFEKNLELFPNVEASEAFGIKKVFYDWFYRTVNESSPLSEECIQAAIGVNHDAYRKFVSACFAIAQFHADVVATFSKRLREDPSFDSGEVHAEFLEWVAPFYQASGVVNEIVALSELDADTVDRLLKIYAASYPKSKNAGDGYFPPFSSFADCIMFSPYVVQSMLSSRNILYSISRTDQRKFDELISKHMEPHLVAEVEKQLQQIPGLQIESNIIWEDGEFDLLVYDASENAVLTIQAKASVPPDGARMTARTEDRMLEGLEQLERFVSIKQKRQDEVLSSALGRKVSNVKVVKVVLGWSGFGTKRVWDRMTGVAPLNIATLKHLVRTSQFSVSGLVESTYAVIDEIVQKSAAKWEANTQNLGVGSLTIPLLKFDTRALLPYMNR